MAASIIAPENKDLMPQQLRSWLQLVCSLVVFYLGVSALLPEETAGFSHGTIVRQQEAPRFSHLLTAFTEEVSEEEDEQHATPTFPEPGDFIHPASTDFAAPATAQTVPATNSVARGNTPLRLLICVFRV